MFTIKHIMPNGDERIVECDSLVAKRRDDGFMQYTAFPANTGPDTAYTDTWCGNDRHPDKHFGHALYVMNRFGATVATHRFVEPDFVCSVGSASAAQVA